MDGEEAVGLDDGGAVVVIIAVEPLTGTSMSNRSKVIREDPLKQGSGSFRSIISCIPGSLNVCEYRRSYFFGSTTSKLRAYELLGVNSTYR